jgi:hypothetical protein
VTSSRWLTNRSRGTGALLPAVLKYVAERAPEARVSRDGGGALEHTMPHSEKAHTVAASVLEGTTVRAHRIPGSPESGFAAFLDGIQSSRVIAHLGGIPLIVASVAAIIRERRNRRLVTAHFARETALYVPRQFVPSFRWDEGGQFRLVDTSTERPRRAGSIAPQDPISPHPTALVELAYSAIRDRREALEVGLAERWCGAVPEPGQLYVDGSIAGSSKVGTSMCVVGVVKSHRVLYAEGDAMRAVLGLRVRERSSILRLTSKQLWPAGVGSVATWYLRIRDPEGQDPLWGLVRVEIPSDRATPERADQVSGWILAETSPLSLPDARWDTMVYGIRDCEQTLRAI